MSAPCQHPNVDANGYCPDCETWLTVRLTNEPRDPFAWYEHLGFLLLLAGVFGLALYLANRYPVVEAIPR